MWDMLNGLPKAILYLLLGAALGIYLAGYFTAFSAKENGFEAEFSDYGLLT